MKIFPEEIVSIEDSQYRVRLRTTDPDGTFLFTFRVDGEAIRVVVPDPEFERLIGLRTWLVIDLLKAIHAFDRAQGIELGDAP